MPARGLAIILPGGLRDAEVKRVLYSFGRHVGSFLGRGGVCVPLAIVHHANQYIITNGYDNRPGIQAVVGSKNEKRGLAWILELHRAYKIPANIHISGTLLESLAWYQPQFLRQLKEMYQKELLEFVGSSYAQNIMRFFDHEHNLKQLNEELDLYRIHLGVDPRHVKSFWPPERVWDTPRMAAVLRDPTLRNRGYDYVFIDDRLLLPVNGRHSTRRIYDRNQEWDPQLFNVYRIRQGHGLIALPIAANLRQCLPPRGSEHWRRVQGQLEWLSSLDPASHSGDFLAIYGDDMEKPAAVGWESGGPRQFEAFLRWLSKTQCITPVRVSDWASTARIAGTRVVAAGTYMELANHFKAGEKYEKWYFDRRWTPYRGHLAWSENRVKSLVSLGADPALTELAEKHLLASNWETAWHTPHGGAHGNPKAHGAPSGSICAVASHSRHAAVIAEAGFWLKHKDHASHAYLSDIDNDGEQELILRNDKLFAVVSPRRGGRLVALFTVDGRRGTMVIGNPCDDWNLKEELNDYMDVPPNHPGALADVGFEHDSYTARIVVADGSAVHAQLRNDQANSPAFGLTKDFYLSSHKNSALRVAYSLPENLSELSVEFGLSPDYLNLLRRGRSILRSHARAGARGWATETVAVWVKPEHCTSFQWTKPYQDEFGHGRAIRLSVAGRQFGVSIGVEIRRPNVRRRLAKSFVAPARGRD